MFFLYTMDFRLINIWLEPQAMTILTYLYILLNVLNNIYPPIIIKIIIPLRLTRNKFLYKLGKNLHLCHSNYLFFRCNGNETVLKSNSFTQQDHLNWKIPFHDVDMRHIVRIYNGRRMITLKILHQLYHQKFFGITLLVINIHIKLINQIGFIYLSLSELHFLLMLHGVNSPAHILTSNGKILNLKLSYSLKIIFCLRILVVLVLHSEEVKVTLFVISLWLPNNRSHVFVSYSLVSDPTEDIPNQLRGPYVPTPEELKDFVNQLLNDKLAEMMREPTNKRPASQISGHNATSDHSVMDMDTQQMNANDQSANDEY